MTYLFIFGLRILENSLATLRLILVSNGKKLLGSILLALTSIIWLTSSSIAIKNINIIMVLIFSIGSLVGSFVGSLIEEKLALGNNLLICIASKPICDDLRSKGYIVTKVQGEGYKDDSKDILLIVTKRKLNRELISIISNLDSDAVIVSEYTNILYSK